MLFRSMQFLVFVAILLASFAYRVALENKIYMKRSKYFTQIMHTVSVLLVLMPTLLWMFNVLPITYTLLASIVAPLFMLISWCAVGVKAKKLIINTILKFDVVSNGVDVPEDTVAPIDIINGKLAGALKTEISEQKSTATKTIKYSMLFTRKVGKIFPLFGHVFTMRIGVKIGRAHV